MERTPGHFLEGDPQRPCLKVNMPAIASRPISG